MVWCRSDNNVVVGLVFVGLIVFIYIHQFSNISVSEASTSHAAILQKTKTQATTSSTQPNFIFFLADDLAWNSIGYESDDLASMSPFMTKLAAKGIKMSNYYSAELCVPGRASLLTGRYPLSMGIQYDDTSLKEAWGLNLSETLLPAILKDNGYTTYMLGKWDLGEEFCFHSSPLSQNGLQHSQGTTLPDIFPQLEASTSFWDF